MDISKYRPKNAKDKQQQNAKNQSNNYHKTECFVKIMKLYNESLEKFGLTKNRVSLVLDHLLELECDKVVD